MANAESRYLTGLITDRRFLTDGMAAMLGLVFGSGTVELGSNLQVSPGAGLSVAVSPGAALVRGFPYSLKSTALFPLDAADAQARIDRVMLRLDTSPDGKGVMLAVKTGTPAASPAPPSLTGYEISLARVTVPASASSITTGNITDERTLCKLKPMPNDYVKQETGIWTPILYGATTAGTPAYATQMGRYTKLGRRVFADFRIHLSAVGGMAGAVYIGGLPFAMANEAWLYNSGILSHIGGISRSAGDYQFMLTTPGGAPTFAVRYTNGDIGGNLAASELTASSVIAGQLIYDAAA